MMPKIELKENKTYFFSCLIQQLANHHQSLIDVRRNSLRKEKWSNRIEVDKIIERNYDNDLKEIQMII